MRFHCHALMLPDPDRARVSPDDPELSRLIRAERIRMLLSSTVSVAGFSSFFAVALALLLAPQMGQTRAFVWAGLCVVVSILRVLLLGAYLGSRDRASTRWLTGLNVLWAMNGLVWGLAGAFMPVQDLVTSAVIVATLIGACAVCTFTLQAHIATSMLMNLPLLLPAGLKLFTRLDAFGLFGGLGLLALFGLMMLESRRVERRTTELLWLRFTTDRIARERAEALKLAQRHSAVKDQFLATMSHEMRTPLHGILGLARLVHNRLPNKLGPLTETRQQVELIERTGEHLLGIINDVLDFSRIEAGKLQLNPSAFELHGVINDVLSVLRVAAAEKGLRLRTTLDLPTPCWVRGDAARVRQVLLNLLGNAIKFTEQGEVRLDVARQADPQAEGKPVMRFQIEDTGAGISPPHLLRIFEAFHQVDGTFARKQKGTGLGLTISREIARAMGGDIVCTSVLDQGSTFTLTLPLPDAQVEQVDLDLSERPAVAPEPLPGSSARAHVLMAEDNPVNAIVAEAILAQLAVVVTRVENGLEALAELQRPDHPYDLVLMDCQMPELDGIEATRRLRAWEHQHGRPPVPVVALTANALSSDRERCLAAGMNEHLAKPFRPDELQAVLMRHLQARQTPPVLTA